MRPVALVFKECVFLSECCFESLPAHPFHWTVTFEIFSSFKEIYTGLKYLKINIRDFKFHYLHNQTNFTKVMGRLHVELPTLEQNGITLISIAAKFKIRPCKVASILSNSPIQLKNLSNFKILIIPFHSQQGLIKTRYSPMSCQVTISQSQSSFSQTYKIGNVGIIANFVFPFICSFLLYLYQLMFVNVQLEIEGHIRITF